MKKCFGFFITKGQSTVEYLMLFVILACLTLIGISKLFPSVRQAAEGVFNQAVSSMGLHF